MVGWLPRQPRGETPTVQAVGATLTSAGVHCWMLRVKPNRSRAKTLTLRIIDDHGRETDQVRVRWPRLSDGEWRGATLEYSNDL